MRSAAAALLLLAAAGAARADVTVSTTLGYEGAYVPGSVNPVSVEISSSEKEPVECRLTLLPPRSPAVVTGEGLVTTTDVFLAPGARKRVTLPLLTAGFVFDEVCRLRIQTGRKVLLRHGVQYEEGRSMTVSVGATGTTPPTFERCDTGSVLVGLLGAPAGTMNWMGGIPRGGDAAAFRLQDPYSGERLRSPEGAWALPRFLAVEPARAPDPWICYEGLDALLWIDPDTEVFGDPAQLEAILDFAAHGGRLLVALTPGARIPGDSPLAAALPGLAGGHDDVPLPEVAAALTGTAAAGVPPVPVPVARIAAVRGRVAASLPDGRPLLLERDHGMGTVVALAFDPRLLGSSALAQRAGMLAALFGALSGPEPVERTNQAADLDPLLDHLRKRFLKPPPLALLIVGLVLYVLAIGPVDYFLLKRKGRLRRTVVTFPIIVASFTALAWASTFLLFGGTAGSARVAWIDFATAPARDADIFRGLDMLGAYSPTGVNLQAAWDAPRTVVAAPWLGTGSSWYDPGEGRAVDGIVAVGPDGRPSVEVEVPLRSHRTVQARFSGEVPTAIDARLTGPPEGRVLEVRNGLPLPVRDLVLVSGGRALALGDLEPGARIDRPLDGRTPWTVLSSSLSDPHAGAGGMFTRSGSRGSDPLVPEDDSEAASAEARRAMARAAMGASVTGLFRGRKGGTRMVRTLARQGLDLSLQAAAGRPILMGWCEGDPLGILPGGRSVDSTVVVVRRVLPAGEEAR